MGSQDEYPQPQILHLLAGWYTTYIESTDLVVPRDHAVQPLARERRGTAGLHLERLGQEALRQPVVGARPALAGVERALGEDDPPRRRLELPRVDVPAAHGAQEARPLGVGLLEDAAQELAEDQRVHDRGAVLGLDRGGDVRFAAREAVEAPGQVGLVGARAGVVRTPGVDREAERHRLQRARLVAGGLHALDVRRERVRALPDLLRRRARALGEQRADALARADLVDHPQQRVGVPEAQPRRVDQAALDALHRPRDRAAGGDGVEPELVAAAARGEHRVRVGDAAQRTEREDVLVLDAHALAAGALVDVLAADGARRAAVARDAARLGEVLGGQARGVGERRLAEVAGRQRGDRVEREQVRERAELAVLRRRRAERAPAQVARGLEDRARVGRGHLRRGPDRNGFEELGPEHGAEAAAAGVAAVVRDRRVLDEVLARGADRGDAPRLAEPLAKARLGLRRGQAPEVARGLEPRAVPVDQERRRLGARAGDDDRVVARELAGDREVARGERVVEHPGEGRLRHDGELRARRQRRADERREAERERRLGAEGVDARRREAVHEPRAEARAADIGAQDVLGQGQRLGARIREVDDEGAAEVAARWAGRIHVPTGYARRRPVPAPSAARVGGEE